MRVVFAGTPRAAVPSLEELLRSKHEVVAVLTRPDAAAGRGRQVGPSPVAQCAASAGIEVLKPASPRDPAFLDRLRALAPDCCPVTAYGALIPRAALEIPPHGWVNLHFSLLPAWRGAAPVPHAIWHGDEMTGATTFRLVAELDAGPVYGVMTEPIGPGDTAGDLLARLATAGAGLLAQTLDGIESGDLRAVPQPTEGISHAPKLTTGDARVRWGDPALAVGRQIRACTPAPGAWTMLGDARLKLWPVRDCPQAPGAPLRPGELRVTRSAVLAGTATHPVELGDVQQGGKRRMPATEWARGLRLGTGEPGSGQPGSGAGYRAGSGRDRRRGPGAGLTWPPAAPQHRPGRRPAVPRPRPARSRWTCCSRSPSGMPTPTCCSRPCFPSAGCTAATRRSPPSWPTGRSAAAAATTPCWPPAAPGRWPTSTPRCWTCSGSAPTSCWRPGSARTRRWPRRSRWPGPWPGQGAAGFANAVLRRVATRDLDSWIAAVAPDRAADPVGYLAVKTSHPGWIVAAVSESLGEEPVTGLPLTEAALAANGIRPRVTLCAVPGLATPADLLARGSQPARWSPFGAYLDGGDPAGIPEVRQGRVAVQDEASQLAALALTRAETGTARSADAVPGDPDADRRWLDLCAGPGGKARLLAGLAAGRGARLLAADVREHRARLVRAAVAPTGAAAVVVADGTQPAWRRASFDRVIADVPCSGLGALRRRPDARWRKTPADVMALGELQRSLLRTAINAARPGGVIAYVTCSPHIAETRAVVGQVTAARDDVLVLDAPALLSEVPDLACPAPGGRYAQFWPHLHGTDAIFLALLRKR